MLLTNYKFDYKLDYYVGMFGYKYFKFMTVRKC